MKGLQFFVETIKLIIRLRFLAINNMFWRLVLSWWDWIYMIHDSRIGLRSFFIMWERWIRLLCVEFFFSKLWVEVGRCKWWCDACMAASSEYCICAAGFSYHILRVFVCVITYCCVWLNWAVLTLCPFHSYITRLGTLLSHSHTVLLSYSPTNILVFFSLSINFNKRFLQICYEGN